MSSWTPLSLVGPWKATALMTRLDVETAIAQLPPEAFLGQAVTFTPGERDVSLTSLRSILLDRQLRTETLVDRIRRVDAFKRASNEIATTFPRNPTHQDCLVVKHVGQDAQESHRLVVLERRTPRTASTRPSAETHTIWRIMYDRGIRGRDGSWRDDFINVEQQAVKLTFSDVQRDWLQQMIGDDGAALRARFEHHSTHLDITSVRRFVRRYLVALGGINLRGGASSGGLYFVPRDGMPELAAFTDVVATIGSSLHGIPVVNNASQRAFIAATFVDELTAAVMSVSLEIQQVLDDARRITLIGCQRHTEQAQQFRATLNNYEHLLGRQLPQARDRVQRHSELVAMLNGRLPHGKRSMVAAKEETNG